ncbi:progranulin-like [Plectropomus leopardus]|uniref:progranulin-like n=1 Tax=Plectropomus leopardus TaxID=160734 RepID=UPI001C4BCE3C|nr:progranulin-like [Plectropomus leopardus]
MLRLPLWLLVGVLVWEFASCSITCPDGNICSDFSTCCMTKHGYSCCPYPNAVCCSDLAHCCPQRYRCNEVTQMCEREPWMSIPMVKKEAAKEPSTPVETPPQEPKSNLVPDQKKSSVVHCDNYYYCLDGQTCCRYPTGAWWCCPFNIGRCCRDGFHCCQYGYDCDYTFTHCVRQGLIYPFTPKHSAAPVPASRISTSEDKSTLQETPMTALSEATDGITDAGVIRCDSTFFCSVGKSCCKGPTGQWSCCPYALGQCCADGQHCCKYGYNCDPTSLSCTGRYSQIPSGDQERAKTD